MESMFSLGLDFFFCLNILVFAHDAVVVDNFRLMKNNDCKLPLDFLEGRSDFKLNGCPLKFVTAKKDTLKSGDLKLLDAGFPVVHRKGGEQLNVFVSGPDGICCATIPRESLQDLSSALSEYGMEFQAHDKSTYGLK